MKTLEIIAVYGDRSTEIDDSGNAHVVWGNQYMKQFLAQGKDPINQEAEAEIMGLMHRVLMELRRDRVLNGDWPEGKDNG